jgi:hypothetical protein
MLASESIRAYLETTRNDGNADLIDRLNLHGTSLELQVNVSPRGGEPVHGKRNTYTDGVDQWFSFRIPKGAFTNEATWKDFKMRYNLLQHIDSIGSTGWDWENKRSLWMGFDFDTIAGHAVGVGITDHELDKIRKAACGLPYLEVRRSTGGNGLHLYAHVDGVPTQNHTEHAALARVILLQMSEDVGFDLTTKVDVCGSNMWVAAKRASAEAGSFELIKAHEQYFDKIPDDWLSNVDVVTRKRTRVSVPGMPETADDMFSRLASAHRRVELDASHIAVRAELARLGCCVWVQDHYLLQTHTALLKQVMDHTDLDVEGVFETNSPGSNTGEPNCFAYPLDDGVWRVYRFGPGTVEHPSWEQDGRGWTTCFYNTKPKLDSASHAADANKTKKGHFEFTNLKEALECVARLSNDPNFNIPASPAMLSRPALVGKTASGEIFIEVKKEDGDNTPQNWNSSDRKGYHTAMAGVHAEPEMLSALDYDNKIRCLKTVACDPAGWASLSNNGHEWDRQNSGSVKMILQAHGHPKPEAECIMGVAVQQAWKLVSIPFADEYPGNRQWNLSAPQLAYDPLPYEDDHNESPHLTWDLVLDHIGQSLTSALSDNEWADMHGVASGRQYLEMWLASVIRFPYDPLPYLFMYGPENSGKSIFHEAFSLLVTKGVVFADRALTSSNDFNGELEGCILAVVEEKNIAQTPGAHNKIKQSVTAEELSIRRMRTDSYMIRNTTHWCQMSNEPDACPVFSGDTRIIALLVPEIAVEIPKQKLLTALRDEAPHFLYTLLNLDIPPTTGRLRVPVINTAFKDQASDMNKDYLDMFIESHCEMEVGAKVLYADFYNHFCESLPAGESRWPRKRLTSKLAMIPMVETIKGAGNKSFVGGLKWQANVDCSQH